MAGGAGWWLRRIVVVVVVVVAGVSAGDVCRSAVLSVLTYNVLQAEEAFADGWGCPAEIARRDGLVAGGGVSRREAEARLSRERFRRLSRFLDGVRGSVSVMALQEVDALSPSLLDVFVAERGPWRVACTAVLGTETTVLLVDVSVARPTASGTVPVGCSCYATVDVVGGPTVTIVAVKLPSGPIRDPTRVEQTVSALLHASPAASSSPSSAAIIMGDFNTHLPDLLPVVSRVAGDPTWHVETARNRTRPMTTQNEANFIAAYDGVLLHGLTARSRAVVHQTGFMPKYLGDGSAFAYADGPFPVISGDLLHGGVVLPGNRANQSLSDHLAVRVDICLRPRLAIQ
ncbi:Endonuclease/exonuclease/phosphatase domain-containing protein [Plasmodiophora brassicae]|uniref:Endonuclease/exonuclease/phosphatase domain-containing protein n=1 Tax=Plasmodiophora brassicae TaxID=37360 RepID=A0A0G4J2L1_PLABS|nr:hypothetical protein PBRA_008727 [Plasmodiophora brassicae]SPQ98409.1 unnamed protein product [Plasmodiophora brassicae]